MRGRPGGDGRGVFSPSGKRFVTACLPLGNAACVWDAATGKAVTRLPVVAGARPGKNSEIYPHFGALK
ncbi:hypothetical protein [Nonomuraea sp. B19D2]|uniref:hypothetical protein n=1 Tax=Nonomuraea sp. B19D2 TaxID=3159561 RepID=UPI0032DB7EB6